MVINTKQAVTPGETDFLSIGEGIPGTYSLYKDKMESAVKIFNGGETMKLFKVVFRCGYETQEYGSDIADIREFCRRSYSSYGEPELIEQVS